MPVGQMQSAFHCVTGPKLRVSLIGPRSGLDLTRRCSGSTQICPGVPDLLLETLLVEIAHFEPTPVLLSVEGVYPTISLGLPRIRDGLFDACLEQALALTTSRAANNAAAASEAAATLRPPAAAALPTPAGSGRASPAKTGSGGSRPGTATSVMRASQAASSMTKKASAAAAEPAAVPERKPDAEADRLRLVSLLREREAAAAGAMLTSATAPVTAVTQGGPGRLFLGGAEGELGASMDPKATASAKLLAESPTATAPAPAAATIKRDKRAVQPPIPKLYASNYVVDFGCVTKGMTRARKFRMANPGSQAATLRFDKALLEAWGFKVDPEAVSKLPERGELEVTLTLLANKPTTVAGPLELVLLLDVKGGPPVLLTLRANIQVRRGGGGGRRAPGAAHAEGKHPGGEGWGRGLRANIPAVASLPSDLSPSYPLP